jgi:hypothetical protein
MAILGRTLPSSANPSVKLYAKATPGPSVVSTSWMDSWILRLWRKSSVGLRDRLESTVDECRCATRDLHDLDSNPRARLRQMLMALLYDFEKRSSQGRGR